MPHISGSFNFLKSIIVPVLYVWNSVCNIKGRTEIYGVKEQDADKAGLFGRKRKQQ
jgi:hypothetical protein